MSETVKTKKIAEQFAHYMDAQRSTSKSNKVFAEDFLKKLDSIEAKEGTTKKVADSKPRAGLRYSQVHIGGRRKITQQQAARLAKYAPLIESSAKKYNVPVELICGVILQESGAQHRAVSHCGAQGLMQLMPGTAKRFGVKNSFDPAQNIDGGTNYLGFLLNRFKGDARLALAAYNSGEHNVEKYGNRIPPFRETQNYVPAVLGYTQTMVDIFRAQRTGTLPSHARRA